MLTRQMQQLQKCLDRAAKLANTIYQNATQCIATKVWFILMQALHLGATDATKAETSFRQELERDEANQAADEADKVARIAASASGLRLRIGTR